MSRFSRFTRSKYRLGVTAATISFGILLFAIPTFATGSISRGYKTSDKAMTIGTVVALQSSGTSDATIEQASITTQDRVVGIVSTIDSSLLTLTNASAQVHVATAGQAAAFVSDLNGQIKKGDYVSVSPVKGILMHAESQNTWVVGVALKDFSAGTATSRRKIKNQDNTERTINITTLPINIDIQQVSQGKQPSFLVLFGKSITGKPVSQLQVAAAFVIFFILLVVEGSIIYGAIYSGITAVGRNPLAKSVIYHELLQVAILSFFILTVGLGAVYVLLWV